MRWDNLLIEQQTEERTKLPLFADEAVVRRFNTPEFRGITFYEVMAKSIINHVPHDRFGFNFTINTFRGCSHSCSYCIVGETPILMADGRTRPIKSLRPGDRVYGTQFDGKYRRYVITDVLDHWSTLREGYRVRLEDGTELVTSGDHRFLASHRGWKHVVNTPRGQTDRAHLTTNDKLVGVGHFAEPPTQNEAYRRGYLCGLLRGDGHLGSYSYARPGREHGNVHSFRLALVDIEALQRARQYLVDFQVDTREFLFQVAAGGRRAIHAIGTSSLSRVEAIRGVIEWPIAPSLEWSKGFLAGIFDAEGSFSQGIWRVSNTDSQIIDYIVSSLSRFGFSYVLESPKRHEGLKPITCVRMVGEVSEKLRFFHTVDPAITRKRSIESFAIKSKAKLRVMSIEPLGIQLPMFDITTGTGDFIANGVVTHNCFARPSHTYLDFNAGRDFETKIVVKVNAVELLRKELRKPSWSGEHIAMGTNTDPYQRAEGHYKLMRGILKELNSARNPYSILTKGTLIQRDIDLLQEGAAVVDAGACFSVGTVDEKVWRETEPGTPHPMKRLEVVRKLNDAGVPCGVLMAPILPGISDSFEQMQETVKAAVDAHATFITPIVLHLRPGVREEFMPWLEEHHPDLIKTYEAIYRRSYAPKDVTEPIQKAVGNLRRKFGHAAGDRHRRRSASEEEESRAEPEEGEQLSLELTDRMPARKSTQKS
jgi:DNA repair photolyase